ncbi:hypothetical protein HYC85_021331 [Camellia sinensis]|uniref:Uncharacterized protein n=1 Tax=Camellia sinensis TaxID=4442 RepID=A0A7J7GL64_CAMSI|nr:hypothetical protein HYC85_021331 [Camellia sinensis]
MNLSESWVFLGLKCLKEFPNEDDKTLTIAPNLNDTTLPSLSEQRLILLSHATITSGGVVLHTTASHALTDTIAELRFGCHFWDEDSNGNDEMLLHMPPLFLAVQSFTP